MEYWKDRMKWMLFPFVVECYDEILTILHRMRVKFYEIYSCIFS